MPFPVCKSVVSDFKFLLTVFVMECKLDLGVVCGWQRFKICLNYEQEEKRLDFVEMSEYSVNYLQKCALEALILAGCREAE